MEFIQLIEELGFNIALVAALCFYISRLQQETRADWQRSEEHFLQSLKEQTDINKKLLETNTILTQGIIPRLENIEEKINKL
ncbi:MAG: hypothetical protein HUJ63_00140 [Enterococcus sp.]|nr:hypothetical protein [Enterococcus sp.]